VSLLLEALKKAAKERQAADVRQNDQMPDQRTENSDESVPRSSRLDHDEEKIRRESTSDVDMHDDELDDESDGAVVDLTVEAFETDHTERDIVDPGTADSPDTIMLDIDLGDTVESVAVYHEVNHEDSASHCVVSQEDELQQADPGPDGVNDINDSQPNLDQAEDVGLGATLCGPDEADETGPQQHGSNSTADPAKTQGALDPVVATIQSSKLDQRVLGNELTLEESFTSAEAAKEPVHSRSERERQENKPAGVESLSQEEAVSALIRANSARRKGPMLGMGIIASCLLLSGGLYYYIKPLTPAKNVQYRQSHIHSDATKGQDQLAAVRSEDLMASLDSVAKNSIADEPASQGAQTESIKMADTITPFDDPAPLIQSVQDSEDGPTSYASHGDTTNGGANGMPSESDATGSFHESLSLNSDRARVKRINVTPHSLVSKAHTITKNPDNSSAHDGSVIAQDNIEEREDDSWAAPSSSLSQARTSVKQRQALAQVRSGYRNFQRGYYGASERHYKRALALDPQSKDARLGLAALAQIAGDLTEALHQYHQVLKGWPKNDIALAGMSSLSEGSDSTTIETDLKLLLEEHPKSAHIAFVLGNIYANRRAWREAQDYYFRAWSSDRQNSNYLYNLAVSLDHLNDKTAAIESYEKLLAQKPAQTAMYKVNAVINRLGQLRSSVDAEKNRNDRVRLDAKGGQ
jgi:tetratricopeptide (TPR) repeat protein